MNVAGFGWGLVFVFVGFAYGVVSPWVCVFAGAGECHRTAISDQPLGSCLPARKVSVPGVDQLPVMSVYHLEPPSFDGHWKRYQGPKSWTCRWCLWAVTQMSGSLPSSLRILIDCPRSHSISLPLILCPWWNAILMPDSTEVTTISSWGIFHFSLSNSGLSSTMRLTVSARKPPTLSESLVTCFPFRRIHSPWLQ